MATDDDDDGVDEDDDDVHADWLCGWWRRGHKQVSGDSLGLRRF